VPLANRSRFRVLGSLFVFTFGSRCRFSVPVGADLAGRPGVVNFARAAGCHRESFDRRHRLLVHRHQLHRRELLRHAYFTGGDEPYEKLKRALRAEIDEAAGSALYSTVSRLFAPPETRKIAVKVISHYGDEVLKVSDVVSNPV